MESIPLTLSGKIDKKRLPEPSAGEPNRARFQAPTTELEQRLATAWKRNLGIEHVGITDNYFSLGGDSIRSIALVTHARSMGLDFRVKDLFTHPTIASLAEAITSGGVDQTHASIPEAFDLITEEERTTLLQSFS
jgi:aryl carrier-like protein